MSRILHEIPEIVIRGALVIGSGYSARPGRFGMEDVVEYAKREGVPVLLSTLRVHTQGDKVFISGERGGVFDHSDMD